MNNFKNKKILILGLGREGQSSLRFLKKHYPNNEIAIADKFKWGKSDFPPFAEKYKSFCGKGYLKAIRDYDVIIKSPGINNADLNPYLKNQTITSLKKQVITKPYLKNHNADLRSYLENQVVTSQTEIFLEKHRDKTIAITGTKGKGMTASLLYKIIKSTGKKVELIGNMGKPALDFYNKKNCWFVFEVSSHQLENLKISPHIAVFLNIYADHLDFFNTFKRYFTAKKNITINQSKKDYFIYNKNSKALEAIKTKAKKIAFTKTQNKGLKQIPFKSSWFLENINAAIAVAKLLKIKEKDIQKTIKSYKPFEHRLEIVGTYNGIKFINDSAATIPEATIAGLNNFDNIDTLILGGSEKKSDFKNLAKEIIKKNIKTIILFPITGKKILKEIKKQKPKKLPKAIDVKNMKQAVVACYKNTKKGSACLLSPACASFSIFKDYQDRGEQFKKYVKELANSKR
ncbi:UDP-N-acetylmuramoyl-L-alanine--D-glutamate ligase [Patescibacteria group bacterium]|nr:UDP-N-acetylmuramoyl-L-alanine--D-glutamate ligase [Patescibacteria group bacterium]MBU4078359.1 UDP-N-acetylmuramoyl-L-alanine--D-glutamate ligase [Patescibacteria group bacterium]